MPAYCIGTISIRSQPEWDAYRERVGATIAQYGGTVVFRGQPAAHFSGDGEHDAVVVLQFESLGAARRWHDSPEYQALVPLRDAGARVQLILYGA